jgi:hypothetical protein
VANEDDVMAGSASRREPNHDASPAPLTRWAAALVLLFLADAVQVLLLLPDRTGELFAWRIQPEINAGILGSAYVAGSYFFMRVCTGSPWRLVANGFPPVIVFVWLAGIATFLHLDRLNGGGLPLTAWVALYVVSPLLVPAVFLVNRRRAHPAPPGEELPKGLRLVLGAGGSAVLMLGLIVFLAPAAAIDTWPWPLTPLTARVVAAVIALYGSLWVTIALRGDATTARIPLESHVLGLAFVLLAVARGEQAIDWNNALAPLFLAATAAMLATSAAARLSLRDLAGSAEATATRSRRPEGHGSARRPAGAGPLGVRWRPAGMVLLAALTGGAVATLIFALGPTERQGHEQGERFAGTLMPVPTNHVTADGRATLRLNGDLATVTVRSNRLVGGRHLMHIHAGARGTCPPASAARLHRGHRTISTTDGGPFYGKALASLTTRGDTTISSFLAFARYPNTTTIRYARTLKLTSAVADLIRADNAVILIHGIDYNYNGLYDFGLDRSDLQRTLPGEATAPALCGPLARVTDRQSRDGRRGSTATQIYIALLKPPASHRRTGSMTPPPG